MKTTVILMTILLILLFGGCADGSDTTAENALPATETTEPTETTEVEMPPELTDSLSGKTVVLVVTERFLDPEYRKVRRLFEQAGAEILVLSDLPDPAGEGGSEVVANYRVSQLSELPPPDAAYILHSGSVMALPSYPEFIAWLKGLRQQPVWLATSGVGVRVLAEAELIDGVSMSVYAGQLDALEAAGAVINEANQVTIDSIERVGSCTFWPKGGELAVRLIEAMAAE